jgi:hypothetical protein
MTRFEYTDDPGFIAITGELRRWVKEMTALSNVSAPGAGRSEQGKQVQQEHNTQRT